MGRLIPGRAAWATALACCAMTLAAVATAYAFQPYGRRWPSFAVGACALAGLVWPRNPLAAWAALLISPRRDRVLFGLKAWLAGLIACWLGLTAWAEYRPGGPAPAPKDDARSIRVVTWNVLHGRVGGPWWTRNGWSRRKGPLREAIREARPDLLCLQEPYLTQLQDLHGAMPHARRVGVGRDDGVEAGEFCAIYYDLERFQELASGTFWLEPPGDRPPGDRMFRHKRVCTWARLRDRTNGRTLRVYNTHQYLTETSRLAAARVVRDAIARGEPGDGVVLAGDFNAAPDAASRRVFEEIGLVPNRRPTRSRRAGRISSMGSPWATWTPCCPAPA